MILSIRHCLNCARRLRESSTFIPLSRTIKCWPPLSYFTIWSRFTINERWVLKNLHELRLSSNSDINFEIKYFLPSMVKILEYLPWAEQYTIFFCLMNSIPLEVLTASLFIVILPDLINMTKIHCSLKFNVWVHSEKSYCFK